MHLRGYANNKRYYTVCVSQTWTGRLFSELTVCCPAGRSAGRYYRELEDETVAGREKKRN